MSLECSVLQSPPGQADRALQEIDLGEELEEVTGPHGARLHEVLSRVAGEAGAHEDVEHVVHRGFHLRERAAQTMGQARVRFE